jgi:cell wall-associated NlpC family hydrolase
MHKHRPNALTLTACVARCAAVRSFGAAQAHANWVSKVGRLGVAITAAVWLGVASAGPTPPDSSKAAADAKQGSAATTSARGKSLTAPAQVEVNGPAASALQNPDDAIAALLREFPPGAGLASPPGDTKSPLSLLGLPADMAASSLESVRDKASSLVSSAMGFLGVPYKRGGRSAESGFDCSGFTRHIFESTLGLLLPHRADDQARLSNLIPIRRDELKPGDLVFFNTMRRTFSHVGIYVGEGRFIHAPRAGGKVRVEELRVAYWDKRFTGARRVEPLQERTQAAAGNGTGTASTAQITDPSVGSTGAQRPGAMAPTKRPAN